MPSSARAAGIAIIVQAAIAVDTAIPIIRILVLMGCPLVVELAFGRFW